MYSNMCLGTSVFIVCVHICNGVTESSAPLHAWRTVDVRTYIRMHVHVMNPAWLRISLLYLSCGDPSRIERLG